MENNLITLSPKNNGKIVCIVGKSGAGKTSFLQYLYKREEENGEGNVLFIHAPSRIRENYPSFIVRKRRNMDEMSDIIQRLGKEEGIKENVSSSKEILGIIHTFLLNGVINKGSMIILDSLDALMDTNDMKTLLSILETMRREKGVRIITSVSTIIGVRAIETYMSDVEFYEIKKGKERVEMERRERSEEVYSFFLRGMEDL